MVVNLNIGEKGCKKCRTMAGKGKEQKTSWKDSEIKEERKNEKRRTSFIKSKAQVKRNRA